MTHDFTASTTITTDDGLTLEAEWVIPPQPTARVVLTHPHPQAGGNMTSLVISTLFTHLVDAGHAVLRFNFRGVGNSEGEHDMGEGEQLDVRAAVEKLNTAHHHGPLLLAGWSFGADLALTCDDPALAGWFLVAPPLRVLPASRLRAAGDPRPKWLAVPERDEFNPPDSATSTTQDWTNAVVHTVPGANHFLVGRTDHLNALIDQFLTTLT